MMKKIILSLFAILFSITLHAQSSVYVTNTSSPNACDGSAYFMDTVMFGSWDWYYADSSLIQSGGYELMNLCPGVYTIVIMENGVSTTETFVVGSGTSGDCSTFGANFIDINRPLGDQTFDGWIQASGYGGTQPYMYTWSNGQTTDMIVYLNPGEYYVTVVDANGCSATISMYLEMMGDTTINNWFYVDVYTTDVSDEGVCDGTAYTVVYGGTAPYTFQNSDGSTTSELTGLCEGVYTTVATDAAGNMFTVNYFIASPDNVIDNGGFPDSTIVDTLSGPTLQDCLLDYLSLDTAYISNISFVGMDSILVTWSFYDANGVYDVLQGYSLDNGFGVYELLIEIFCPQRATDKYVIVKQNVLINESINAISEVQSSDIMMYPNPVQDELTIALSEADQTFVSVTDVTGKIVYSNVHVGNLIHVNTSSLAKGQYVVNVSNRNNNFNRMIVK